jgi:hypothetical protein
MISCNRAACATSVILWQAVDDVLDPKNWDMKKWTKEKNRVFCCIVGLCVNIASELEPVIEEKEFLPFFVESSPSFLVLICRGGITNRVRQMMKHVNLSPFCIIPSKRLIIRRRRRSKVCLSSHALQSNLFHSGPSVY